MKNLKSVNEFWGAVIRRDMSSAVREEDKFHNYEELKEYLKKEIEKQGKNVVIKNLDVSGIEDLSWLFDGLLRGVETLDLSGWNTKGVKYMCSMLHNCIEAKSSDLSGWDTSSVENMMYMFGYCINLDGINLSGWDTGNVENMSNMFYSCLHLKSLDLSIWDISGVEDMRCMFFDCKSLESLDLSGWDTSGVRYMRSMFHNCPAPYKVVNNKIVRK